MVNTSEKVKAPPRASMQILLFVIVFAMCFVLESH